MCVLALFLAPSPRTRLIVAANRDEFRARPASPPMELEPGIFGGKDLVGGGTWLGVNRQGLLVAVTNRHSPVRAPDSWSRGQLVLEALRCGTIDEVETLVRERTASRRLGGVSLVAIAGDRGVCLHWDGTVRALPFGPGAHVVSTGWDLDDPRMPEREVFLRHFPDANVVPDQARLVSFLSSHEGDKPICKHGPLYGTVSSSLCFFDADGVRYLHAEGPPCEARYSDFTPALRRILGKGADEKE